MYIESLKKNVEYDPEVILFFSSHLVPNLTKT